MGLRRVKPLKWLIAEVQERVKTEGSKKGVTREGGAIRESVDRIKKVNPHNNQGIFRVETDNN